MSDLKVCLGKKIKRIRESKNYTQEYLSELVGIEQATLSNIERGKSHPTVDTLQKIAASLEVEPYVLYMFEENKSTQSIIDEISNAIKDDEALAKLVYKFFLCVRYLSYFECGAIGAAQAVLKIISPAEAVYIHKFPDYK